MTQLHYSSAVSKLHTFILIMAILIFFLLSIVKIELHIGKIYKLYFKFSVKMHCLDFFQSPVIPLIKISIWLSGRDRDM